MNTRKFGTQGPDVSEIGLGTWQLGSADWGRMRDAEAEEILNTAVDAGINFFDTADCYGRGLSETRIGRFLKTCSRPVLVATKVGRFQEPGWPDNFSQKVFRKHIENSLRRLQVEALDLTQLHCLPPDVLKQGDVFDWLRDLKREGKIQRFGVSVESVEEARLALEEDGVDSIQIIFNLFRQKPISALFDRVKERGVALIVRLPLASGLLSGKFSAATGFPENDHRHFNRNGEHFNVGETFAGVPFETGVTLVEELRGLVPALMSLSDMSLRWILDFDAVTVVVPGATRPNQVLANCATSDLPPLSPELHRRLTRFYDQDVQEHIRGKY
ncbi:MAG: aldo/keto reductase [Nitrospinaceae bacterium]|nr:aldo/keto reductase [Nitrospinaceae bacterium]NIR53355.1 aldo/keto reductase [Nitrospinaceae bacterium]NIS83755.1 aldo/keto reductase [Nitrospinaceae bacterium]NIT80554.1 aldo/keto reductase [Nitrospinaceae bacterium]NIU42879.1 aldo/keto reductase [Nitrospinaceae bacterium]